MIPYGYHKRQDLPTNAPGDPLSPLPPLITLAPGAVPSRLDTRAARDAALNGTAAQPTAELTDWVQAAGVMVGTQPGYTGDVIWNDLASCLVRTAGIGTFVGMDTTLEWPVPDLYPLLSPDRGLDILLELEDTGFLRKPDPAGTARLVWGVTLGQTNFTGAVLGDGVGFEALAGDGTTAATWRAFYRVGGVDLASVDTGIDASIPHALGLAIDSTTHTIVFRVDGQDVLEFVPAAGQVSSNPDGSTLQRTNCYWAGWGTGLATAATAFYGALTGFTQRVTGDFAGAV